MWHYLPVFSNKLHITLCESNQWLLLLDKYVYARFVFQLDAIRAGSRGQNRWKAAACPQTTCRLCPWLIGTWEWRLAASLSLCGNMPASILPGESLWISPDILSTFSSWHDGTFNGLKRMFSQMYTALTRFQPQWMNERTTMTKL